MRVDDNNAWNAGLKAGIEDFRFHDRTPGQAG
jgi:hypothetical protein